MWHETAPVYVGLRRRLLCAAMQAMNALRRTTLLQQGNERNITPISFVSNNLLLELRILWCFRLPS